MSRKRIHLHSKKNIGNELLGKFRSNFLGHAVEFRDFREYSESDDAKYIDWIASSKEQTLIMRRYQEDRESTLQLVIDESRSISPMYDTEKYKLKNTLIELISQACIQNNIQYTGWRVGKNKTKKLSHKNSFIVERRLLENFGDEARGEETFSLRNFVISKKKKSIYIIISDSLDIEEKSFRALALLHDVIFLHISSSFENTLYGSGVRALSGTHTRVIDLDNTTKREQYIVRRKKQLSDFKKHLRAMNIRVGLFESGYNPSLELIKTLDSHH